MSVHEHRARAPRHLRVGIVTVSDTRDEHTDDSGSLLGKLLQDAGHDREHHIVRDDPEAIRAALQSLLASCDMVVLNGGTGISPRDVTIETVEPLFQKHLPGFGELFRMLSYQEVGSAAMLSRATAGIVDGKPVFALPGSPTAVALAMHKLILPEIGHAAGEAVKGTGRKGDPHARR